MAASDGTGMSDFPEDIWMLRPCEIYFEELSDCTSLRGRFHQYYTEGKYRDCEKWRQDYDNCMKFRNKGTKSAAEAIIANEKERRNERLKNARANNVWEYRKTPPEEWNKDIPEWTKKKENTVLAKIQTQIDTAETKSEKNASRCIIS